MSEAPLTDDELIKLRQLLDSCEWNHCDQCHKLKFGDLVESMRYGDDGYFLDHVCSDCADENERY